MTGPCRRGDFVDCLFPFAEHPARPGPMRHIVYVEDVARLPGGEVRALVLLTTTSPRMIAAIPSGLSIAIGETSSRRLGMRRAFVIDAHRLGLLPLEQAWFPEIDTDHFLVGRADDRLRSAVTRRYADTLARGEAIVFGPKPGRGG